MDTEQKTAYELILATLRTTPDPMSVSQLQKEYFDLEGSSIDYKKFGFNSLVDFLKTNPYTIVEDRRGVVLVYPAPDDNAPDAHIAELVKNQKKPTRKSSYQNDKFKSIRYRPKFVENTSESAGLENSIGNTNRFRSFNNWNNHQNFGIRANRYDGSQFRRKFQGLKIDGNVRASRINYALENDGLNNSNVVQIPKVTSERTSNNLCSEKDIGSNNYCRSLKSWNDHEDVTMGSSGENKIQSKKRFQAMNIHVNFRNDHRDGKYSSEDENWDNSDVVNSHKVTSERTSNSLCSEKDIGSNNYCRSLKSWNDHEDVTVGSSGENKIQSEKRFQKMKIDVNCRTDHRDVKYSSEEENWDNLDVVNSHKVTPERTSNSLCSEKDIGSNNYCRSLKSWNDHEDVTVGSSGENKIQSEKRFQKMKIDVNCRTDHRDVKYSSEEENWDNSDVVNSHGGKKFENSYKHENNERRIQIGQLSSDLSSSSSHRMMRNYDPPKYRAVCRGKRYTVAGSPSRRLPYKDNVSFNDVEQNTEETAAIDEFKMEHSNKFVDDKKFMKNILSDDDNCDDTVDVYAGDNNDRNNRTVSTALAEKFEKLCFDRLNKAIVYQDITKKHVSNSGDGRIGGGGASGGGFTDDGIDYDNVILSGKVNDKNKLSSSVCDPQQLLMKGKLIFKELLNVARNELELDSSKQRCLSNGNIANADLRLPIGPINHGLHPNSSFDHVPRLSLSNQSGGHRLANSSNLPASDVEQPRTVIHDLPPDSSFDRFPHLTTLNRTHVTNLPGIPMEPQNSSSSCFLPNDRYVLNNPNTDAAIYRGMAVQKTNGTIYPGMAVQTTNALSYNMPPPPPSYYGNSSIVTNNYSILHPGTVQTNNLPLPPYYGNTANVNNNSRIYPGGMMQTPNTLSYNMPQLSYNMPQLSYNNMPQLSYNNMPQLSYNMPQYPNLYYRNVHPF